MDVRVLEVLWREREQLDALQEGLTVPQIQRALGLKRPDAIYAVIRRLRDREIRHTQWKVLVSDSGERTGMRGPRPETHRIVGLGMCTLCKSDFLLMELRCFPN